MRIALRRTLGLPLAVVAATAFSPHSTATPAQTGAYQGAQFTAEELDNLLAPVALYPDPILAQVLVAASYPDEIELAAYHLSTYGNSGIDDQPWDMSVKAVAHYAPVLNLMADRIDWTIALGQAYVEQPNDVMAAVQSLRSMARAQGNLVNTQQHEVVVEDRYIRILPTQPRTVYVPVYDPVVVYHRPVVHLGVYRSGWSFGVAYPIGVWLTYDFDWRRRHVYYHGWDPYYRRGWIHRSRPYVVINNIYVHSRPKVVVANRGVFNRRFDHRRFDRYNSVHRNVTWERHHRADGRRYAGDGYSWDRNGRNNQGNIGRRTPSWDRSGRMSGNDAGRRAIPRSNVTPRQRTNNGQRAEPRQQTQRSPSWDRNGSSSRQTDRGTRTPSWDRSGRAQVDNNGNRRATGRSTAAPQSGRSAPQRAQPQRSNRHRTEPRAQPQRSSPQQAQPRGQSQRTGSQRAQPQRSNTQRTEPRALPQRSSPQQAQPRGQSQRTGSQRAQPQRTNRQRTEPRAQAQRPSQSRAQQPQRTSPQARSSERAQSSSTRGRSSSAARSAPAQRERASSPSRGNGGKSGSRGRGRRP